MSGTPQAQEHFLRPWGCGDVSGREQERVRQRRDQRVDQDPRAGFLGPFHRDLKAVSELEASTARPVLMASLVRVDRGNNHCKLWLSKEGNAWRVSKFVQEE